MRCGPEAALGAPLRAGSPDAYAGPPGGFGAFGARGHARRAAETLRKITRKAERPALRQSRALPGAKKERLSVRRAHIPHLQTSTTGIICSCLQPVFAPLGLYLGDQGVLFEKCSFDKEGQIDG